jgi:hypothetical protein
VGEIWDVGGGVDGVEPGGQLAAPDEEMWERHTRVLDLIEQVRAARELRRQRGLPGS